MPPRGPVRLTVTFGPACTPVFDRAVAYAAEHADQAVRRGPRTVAASFVLGADPDRYGRALDLVNMVYGWRATLVEIQGSPEYPGVVRDMLYCAREWLRRSASCRERFPAGAYPRCLGCPLYDPEWALESFVRPSFIWGEDPLGAEVPDHLPEEWG
jgi:hypothetical protein